MIYLFIGGVADGQRKQLDRPYPTITIARHPEYPQLTRASPVDKDGRIDIWSRNDYYHYVTLDGKPLYVHASLDNIGTEGLLQRLIDGYKA